MNVDKKWAFLDHLSTSSWNVVCEQPLRQIFNPILLPCKNIFGFCQSESTFAWPNESTMNFCYFWEKDQCTKLNVIKYCQIKGWWKSLDTFKVIYTKYSKHWPYTVAHTIYCVCSKILNHGLNHGFFLSLFKLISCPIHYIIFVLAYSNFKFEFSSSFSTTQNGPLCPNT